MRQVNIHEAKTHFSKLIKEVLNGDEIIIAKGNKPVAKLISIEQTKLKRKLGTAKGKFKITPDFDLPLNDFKDCIK
jgi:prevent-host-death family protein